MPSGNPNIAEAGRKTRFQKGVVTNPKGVPKGTKHITTIIQELLNDEKFVAQVQEGYEVKEYKGAPIKAILQAQIRLALNSRDEGVRIKATDLLLKHGWSSKTENEHKIEMVQPILGGATKKTPEELDALYSNDNDPQASPAS